MGAGQPAATAWQDRTSSVKVAGRMTAQSTGPGLALLAPAGDRGRYFSEGAWSFAGRPWLIQEFLTGQDGEEALAEKSELQREGFFYDFGKAVSRLHTVDIGYFSEDPEPWRRSARPRLHR
jgi:hypothetical protein